MRRILPIGSPNKNTVVDEKMISLLNCENLPVNPWFKYITDDDSDSHQIMRYHSDEDGRDDREKKRKRKIGKKAR